MHIDIKLICWHAPIFIIRLIQAYNLSYIVIYEQTIRAHLLRSARRAHYTMRRKMQRGVRRQR